MAELIEFTVADVVEVLSCARNLNAAIKNCLKREVPKGDPQEKFLKKLRECWKREGQERKEHFIRKEGGAYRESLLILACYAHSDFVKGISEKLVEKYADEFNETYEIKGEGISFKDAKQFKNLVKEILNEIKEGLKEEGLPQNPFMLNAVMAFIFEEPVLKVIISEFFIGNSAE
ncbi:MAG: hypothetical protein D6808_06730 [Candidatus Dadabacteria bacterium]|nr:MAG: hypothetical protein D6808_06730 [Candidatus Dadabacteria bacterium]